MEQKKITAIVRTGRLEAVEQALQAVGVKGITVTRVKGYGEHTNFFSSGWYCTHARIEIYTEKSRVQEIANTIIAAAQTGRAGDGIIAILPVDRLYRIREG
ncbi:MAG: P-II family nitrogen regulator [Acidobacteria bacterium]|nr:P-II family nitrogen regulator [Acidobacteriota bacterium]